MTLIEIYNETGRIPLDERGVKTHGYKYRGVNYFVVAHFRSGNIIEDKVEHLITGDLSSLDLTKKEDETSSGMALDKDNS